MVLSLQARPSDAAAHVTRPQQAPCRWVREYKTDPSRLVPLYGLGGRDNSTRRNVFYEFRLSEGSIAGLGECQHIQPQPRCIPSSLVSETPCVPGPESERTPINTRIAHWDFDSDDDGCRQILRVPRKGFMAAQLDHKGWISNK